MPIQEHVMTAEGALQLINLFDQNQIEVTLDGGWGVDALLGRQTRLHTDLDIVIAYKDEMPLRVLLEARGYREEPDPEARECNILMGDDLGHYVDVHTYTFNPVGHPEFGIDYPHRIIEWDWVDKWIPGQMHLIGLYGAVPYWV